MPIRPLHLMVTFWGARYRNYFVNLCLPSLLAPRNLSLLSAEDGHKFFFATTKDDWREIQALPILERLRPHVQPIHLEVGTLHSGDYSATIRNEQSAFRMLLDAAYGKAAYGCLLSPDHMVSDGMIEFLLHRIQDGCSLVLCPSLRQVEDATLHELALCGLLSPNAQSSQTAEPIVIPARLAARLAVKHLHPDVFVFEEGAKNQPAAPPFRFWRSEQGLILHTFFGTPVLMDFSCVPEDHTACLDDKHMFESTYLSRNYARSTKIHIVRDSDEFILLSLTPSTDDIERSQPVAWRYRSIRGIRHSYQVFTERGEDRLRSTVAQSISRWHAGDRDNHWAEWEGDITRLLDESIGDLWAGDKSLRRRFLYEIVPAAGPSLAARFRLLGHFARHLIRAVTGNRESLRYSGWVLRKCLATILGRSFSEPRPNG